MVKRFLTRNQLRELNSGWSLNVENKEYVFLNRERSHVITIQMLKDLQNKTDVECYAEYPQYTYTDDMFIEEEGNIYNENILKKVLTETEYRTYLKGVIIENVYNENYEEARNKLDELCA